MKELLDEYFKRDLTEAEEQKLAEWLSSSPEESLRFAEKMGAFYKDLGLAEPSWPGGTLPAPKGLGLGKWLVGLILVAGGFLVYEKTRKIEAVVPPSVPQVEATAPAIPVVVRNKKRSQPPPEVSKPVPIPADHVSAMTSLPAPQAASPRSGLPVLAPVIPAAPSDQAPEGETERLTVNVNQPQSGLATVKVVDGDGNQVRALFAGILPAGSHSFTWDGKTDQGLLSQPGVYFLELRSGTDVLRKELDLGSVR